MAKIQVGSKFAQVDEEDYAELSKYRWRLDVDVRTSYAVRRVKKGGKCTFVRMHRQILDAQPGEFVDHRNCDGLDNRRSNLRIATRAENARNCRVWLKNRSGVKGVSWDAQCARWQAHIRVNGHGIKLGKFRTIELAAEAYRAASQRYHGEFGRVA
jgi:phage-related protein